MPPLAADQNSHGTTADFIDTLSSFSRLHRAQRWEGTFGEFLANILPGHAVALARTSHEYVWDMLRWHGRAAQPDASRSEEHTSELQSQSNLVCRLLLEKKKK